MRKSPPTALQGKIRKRLFQANDPHAAKIKLALSNLPLYFGVALPDNNNFFDSIALSLNNKGKALPPYSYDPSHPPHKKLRMLCRKFAIAAGRDNSLERKWLSKALKDEKESYHQYIVNIGFTHDDIQRQRQAKVKTIPRDAAIRGRPHIEGRILCKLLGIKLHILAFQQMTDGLIPIHRLITSSGETTINPEQIKIDDPNIVHIAVYRGHCVPLRTISLLEEKMQAQEPNLSGMPPEIFILICSMVSIPDRFILQRSAWPLYRSIQAADKFRFDKAKLRRAHNFIVGRRDIAKWLSTSDYMATVLILENAINRRELGSPAEYPEMLALIKESGYDPSTVETAETMRQSAMQRAQETLNLTQQIRQFTSYYFEGKPTPEEKQQSHLVMMTLATQYAQERHRRVTQPPTFTQTFSQNLQRAFNRPNGPGLYSDKPDFGENKPTLSSSHSPLLKSSPLGTRTC